MDHTKQNAPYVYLHKKNEDEYHLFTAIIYFSGQTIEISSETGIIYANGSARINYEIKNISKEVGNTPMFFYDFQIITPQTAQANNLDLQSYYIETRIYFRLENSTLIEGEKVRIMLGDADAGSITISNKIALYSPYQYLNNPFAEIDSNPNEFNPKCLIFIKGFIFDSASHQNGNGVFRQIINLIKDNQVNNGEVYYIDPILIPGNSRIYTDLNEIEGYFETIVNSDPIYSENHNKRKGKLRNMSADGNSGGFI